MTAIALGACGKMSRGPAPPVVPALGRSLETPSDLLGVWGSSRKDVFAVGDAGTILHYDGSSWSPMASGTTQRLAGVWGSSGHDVFAVGDGGTILHYTGMWTAMTSGTLESLSGVWGGSRNDVYAVGDAGTILHYNGSDWSGGPGPAWGWNLRGVSGTPGYDVFVVGDRGTILHYDGPAYASWSRGRSRGMIQNLRGVWGSVAVGDGGTILGVGVVATQSGGAQPQFRVEAGAVTSWTALPLRGVWGSSWNDVYVVGDAGTILHYNGSSWSAVTSGTTRNLAGVWVSPGRDAFAVGDSGTILHYGPQQENWDRSR